ncbi:hypothetical protein E2L08_04490 [Palleronia sediminis]|uniref:Uncharacterized protein n=1 Tax=Palleronia sediminis TaxID=2547833 RepID=A0A4R6AJK5_9RHOB|nr:hypothetical protein [Palleronia sediminis]TDL81916.1 hypothetical protein E2L08_04490 [Palleronia sediminis]
MSEDWIVGVIEDLVSYADMNEMDELAGLLRSAASVAAERVEAEFPAEGASHHAQRAISQLGRMPA